MANQGQFIQLIYLDDIVRLLVQTVWPIACRDLRNVYGPVPHKMRTIRFRSYSTQFRRGEKFASASDKGNQYDVSGIGVNSNSLLSDFNLFK